MLGKQVATDLGLDTIYQNISFQTPWGKETFTKELHQCTSDPKEIRRRQLPLLALQTLPETSNTLSSVLSPLTEHCEIIDDILKKTDSRIAESVSQIFWEPTSFGAFLNTKSLLINGLITWKTLVLPGSAILMPILAVILPYFILRMRESSLDTSAYLDRLKTVLLNQISIPTFLKAKGSNDRFGWLLEWLYIGITFTIFVSSLWNQIRSAMHLRNIVADIRNRGTALQDTIAAAERILKTLNGLPLKKRRAFRHILEKGAHAMDLCRNIVGFDGLATFGAVWNGAKGIHELRDFLGHVDTVVSISQLKGICIPKCVAAGLELRGVHHPALTSCISNNFSGTRNGHAILTGPNRGGKSTFCRAVGLAVVCAQSWGFAWARTMEFAPFSTILTALEPGGHLGELSTFEAEIEFAKHVLATDVAGRVFVMMDEIFHSTNATDGIAASKVFMGQLYERTGVVSLISTHYKDLADAFRDKATPLMMVATSESNGRLSYTYRVQKGISDKSSVMEILYERGLIQPIPKMDT